VALVDEVIAGDPRKQVSAGLMELYLWQVGGLGLAAPLAAFVYEPGAGGFTERIRWGAFAWDTANLHVMDTPSFTWFAATRHAAGDYQFDFSATAPGVDGSAQAIAFVGGMARPQGISGSDPGNLRAELERVDANSIRVRVRAQPGGALTECPVAVAVW